MPSLSGSLHVLAELTSSGRTAITRQSFRAPFHISKPYWDGHALILQVVNPTAGILEGDTLSSTVEVAKGAALLVTQPSASRAFRMRDGQATCEQHFTVREGGWLEYLPEPLVPHRMCSYRQVTTVTVERGGELYFAETVAPGRVEHGESLAWNRFELQTELVLGGERVVFERIQQTGDEMRLLARLARVENPWFATVLMLSEKLIPVEETWRERAMALNGPQVKLGVTRIANELWGVKVVADDNIALRATLKALRELMAEYLMPLRADPRKL